MSNSRKATTTTTSVAAAAFGTKTKTATMLICYTVIIALAADLFLSVDAIRCHQCNSHTHEDCTDLRVNTPRAQLDDQYLKDCEGEHAAIAFCRKTVLHFDVHEEQRIERGCGWIKEASESLQNTCYSADNEGYKQTICSCDTDGCNAAPTQLSSINKSTVFALSAFSVLLAAVLRR